MCHPELAICECQSTYHIIIKLKYKIDQNELSNCIACDSHCVFGWANNKKKSARIHYFSLKKIRKLNIHKNVYDFGHFHTNKIIRSLRKNCDL